MPIFLSFNNWKNRFLVVTLVGFLFISQDRFEITVIFEGGIETISGLFKPVLELGFCEFCVDFSVRKTRSRSIEYPLRYG